MAGKGRFVWYDLWTTDREAARSFYTEVTGWGTQEWSGGEQPYVMWTVGETTIGGIGPLPEEEARAGVPPRWAGFVAVDDADRATGHAQELGGTVLVPGTDIPEVGRFAVIADPQGAVIALLQRLNEAPGFDRTKAGFVGWHELHTTGRESAWAFYSELFGWQHAGTIDMGEAGPYLTFRSADEPEDVATGAMFEPDAMTTPPYWLYYVNVEDLDAALERVRRAGGTVIHGPMEVPGGGRIGACKDPQGGRFALFSRT